MSTFHHRIVSKDKDLSNKDVTNTTRSAGAEADKANGQDFDSTRNRILNNGSSDSATEESAFQVNSSQYKTDSEEEIDQKSNDEENKGEGWWKTQRIGEQGQ